VEGRFRLTASSSLRVGNIIKIHHNERVPADCLFLYTTEKNHSIFIRTDQLDGETDWKLRIPVTHTQNCQNPTDIINSGGKIVANPPTPFIYDFKGVYYAGANEDYAKQPLNLENTLWANTVMASSGYALAMVLYTGEETRAKLNAKHPHTKIGKLDLELNRITKFLFVFMLLLSLSIVGFKKFPIGWPMLFFRFVLLLSYIIPISLRVNLDLAKIFYSLCIDTDDDIPGTIARNSTIPEELGRI